MKKLILKNKTATVVFAAVFLLIMTFAIIGPYPFIRLFSELFQGPKFLHKNQEKVMTKDFDRIFPGAQWLDTDGNVIQAHGGQVQWMPVPDGNGGKTEKYVWIGENKTSGHLGNNVAVYSSEDLMSWKFEGDVLRSINERQQLEEDAYFQNLYGKLSVEEKDAVFECINSATVMERPKMLYNEKTKKYVIWFHSDDATEKNSYNYDVGMAGIAVSDSPYGPFQFVKRMRLSHCPKGQIDCFPGSKGESRDINLFQETDGTAYVVYTSENNKTLYISKLDDTYLNLSADPEEAVYKEDYIRLFPGSMREAPVLAKHEGRYYLMSSSTTGWLSNQARIWSADSIFGDWENDGNPCVGKGASMTFDTQSTCIFQSKEGQWIYYGDRWNSEDLFDSRYVWLPITFEENKLHIGWEESW
ncbi:MAG: glycoside hydrolase family 43 protein [Eubacteriales bacterium]|nr:glycoside hydrolase family 43 protein [Eubacteriales bacterium]